MAKFEGQERRMPKIEACLAEYGWKTLEDADALCKEHGINVEEIVKGVQPIAFENACWAYTLGTAIALKKRLQSCGRRFRGHRPGPAGVLHPRFRCGAKSGWLGSW